MPTTKTPTTTSATDDAAELAERAAEQVQDLTRRGVERARAAAAQLRDQALRASDTTRSYIQDEPLKAVLIAAAAGAAVALLAHALTGRRRD